MSLTTSCASLWCIQMDEKDLRDFFAAMAMIGLVMRGEDSSTVAPQAYNLADDMLFIRDKTEGGIVSALKPKRSAK